MNYFLIRQQLCILERNLEFLQHVNKTPWLYVQQGKCPPIIIQNFTYTCILVHIHDIVWKLIRRTTRIIDSTIITPILNGERPRQREEFVCSMIMISENAVPRNL